MPGNEEQIQYWNGKAGETWVQAQARTDQSLEELTRQALEQAAVKPGEKVLDVGCGCGTTTIALGSGGARVRGIDISAPMLAHARHRAADLANVEFDEADASAIEFEPEYDLVFSRFGVMFFSDPVAAFSNIRRALSPGGRMTFLCWQSPKHNPWMSVGGRIVQPFLAKANPGAPAPDPRAPGPFAFADGDYLNSIMVDAGFSQVTLDVATSVMNLGETVEDAMRNQGEIGPLARALAELDDDDRAEALAAVEAEFQRLIGPDGLKLDAAAWLVSARG